MLSCGVDELLCGQEAVVASCNGCGVLVVAEPWVRVGFASEFAITRLQNRGFRRGRPPIINCQSIFIFTSARGHWMCFRTLQSCFVCTLEMGNKVLCRALWSSYEIFTSMISWCIYRVSSSIGWQSAKALASIYGDLPLASSWSSALFYGSLADTLIGVLAHAFRCAFRSYGVPQDSIDILKSAASLQHSYTSLYTGT